MYTDQIENSALAALEHTINPEQLFELLIYSIMSSKGFVEQVSFSLRYNTNTGRVRDSMDRQM